MVRGAPFLTILGLASLGAAATKTAPHSSDSVPWITENGNTPLESLLGTETVRLRGQAESHATTRDAADAPYTDHRAWQHGISFLRVGDRRLLVWSSWGETPHPTANPEGNWEHDVFYSWIDPKDPTVRAKLLVSGPEAQEPASAAINSSGHILMSCEDGNPRICQRAGLWNRDLTPIKDYGIMIRDGGHSGHVAAMGDRFALAYSEGWIDGGGVDNLGTGDDVWARIVNDDGSLSAEIPVSVSKDADKRDWWPEVAASNTEALEVWQRYPAGTLHGAFIRPNGTASPEFQITDNIKYYYYNVRWLPALQLYAVFGSREDGGFISLIDRGGRIAAFKTGLPDTVRESNLAIRGDVRKHEVVAVYPTLPSGAAVVRLTSDSVELRQTIPADYAWDYMGTDGIFINREKVLFATLSKSGVQLVEVNLAVP